MTNITWKTVITAGDHKIKHFACKRFSYACELTNKTQCEFFESFAMGQKLTNKTFLIRYGFTFVLFVSFRAIDSSRNKQHRLYFRELHIEQRYMEIRMSKTPKFIAWTRIGLGQLGPPKIIWELNHHLFVEFWIKTGLMGGLWEGCLQFRLI